MSRVIPIAVQATLDGDDWSFATCLAVTQQVPGSSLTIRVTTLNRAVVIPSGIFAGTYAPLGFIRHDLTAEDNMGVGTTEVEGILDSAYLTEDDMRAGRWDGAAWKKCRVNYRTPSDGVIYLGSGTLGTVRHGRLRFNAELLGIMQAVQNGNGRLTTPLCTHNFAKSENGHGLGNGCTVDPSLHTQTGTVDAVDSDFYGIHDGAAGPSNRTEADNFYSNGLFRITSGVMTGMEFEIRAYIVGFWILFTALPYDATGATYAIVRGCDKSRRMCIDVFDNLPDRLASDYTQGNDAAVQVARHNG